jgi:hypothetical protein
MIAEVKCPVGHNVAIAVAKLGETIACPCCFTPFLATLEIDFNAHAKKEERKPGRTRDDDDDDDDEDDRPQKKTKSRREEEDEEEDEAPRKKKAARRRDDNEDDEEDDEDEDEAPRKKKATRKRDDDDDEDEEDEDDDEDDDDEDDGDEDDGDEDEEDEIEWTRRKRQLNMCSIGLIILIVATSLLGAFTVFTDLAFSIFLILGGPDFWTPVASFLFFFLAVPCLFLCIIGHMACLFMNLFVPARAEARGPLIGGLVFFGLVAFLSIFIVLTWFGFMMADPDRGLRMMRLLNGVTMIFFACGIISTMAYLAKLMIFMRLHLESSKPITNAAFILLFLGLMLVLERLTPIAVEWIADWMVYVMSFLSGIIAAMAVRVIVLHAFLIVKIRATIAKYIRDA